MNEESRLLMLIWEGLDNLIPASNKAVAATAIVAAFGEMGHDARDLFDLEGEDEYIDAALTDRMEDEEQSDFTLLDMGMDEED